jgi:carbon-monoxide dehydrogenase large subunit
MLEADPDDIDYQAGVFRVNGEPDKNTTFAQVCLQAYMAWKLPREIEPALEESAFYDSSNFVYPFGAHIRAVDIEPDTGKVTFRKYVAVDDCGPPINPMLAEGQVHGGVAQGIGQALYEAAVYDDALLQCGGALIGSTSGER